MMTQNKNDATNGFSLIAPKDIFERKHICYANGSRLTCKGIKETENDKEYSLIYLLTNTIQVDSFTSVLKAFETDNICFAKCQCWGYDRDGYSSYGAINKLEDAGRLKDYWSYRAIYCDRETRLYRFSIIADVNSSYLAYCVKVADFNKKLCV